MSNNVSSIVFDDIFTINDIDKEGKKFDRVSRLFAHSKNYEMDLTLDYNLELFPLETNESFALALATSLTGPRAPTDNPEDAAEADKNVWRPDGKGPRGLEEEYEYVMYGKIYKYDAQTDVATVYISFGGLLMSLTGATRHQSGFVLGDPIYLLMRK